MLAPGIPPNAMMVLMLVLLPSVKSTREEAFVED
jgi:hypothetical protein